MHSCSPKVKVKPIKLCNYACSYRYMILVRVRARLIIIVYRSSVSGITTTPTLVPGKNVNSVKPLV